MRNLLLSTCLMAPSLVMAQTPEAIFEEGMRYLGEAGIDVDVDTISTNGNAMVLSGFTMAPGGEERPWEVRIPALTMVLEGERATLEPEGTITATMRFPGLPIPFDVALEEEDLSMSVFIDMRQGELTGFEVLAQELSAQVGGSAAERLGLSGIVTIDEFAFREQETSVVEMSQFLTWDGASVMIQAIPDPQRESGELMLDLGPVEIEMETLQAGLLEEFPWIAAVGAGMRVDMSMALSRSALTTVVRPAGSEVPNIQRYEWGRMSLDLDQSPESSSAVVSMMTPRVLVEGGERSNYEFMAESLSFDVAAPLHQSGQALPARFGVDLQGGVLSYGDTQTQVAMTGEVLSQVLPLIDWLDYSIVTGESTWRDPNRVFVPQSLASDGVTVTVDGQAYDVSMDLEAVNKVSPGLTRDMAGVMTLTMDDTTPLLEVLGQSGLLDERANMIVLSVLSQIFGDGAGQGGGVAEFELQEGSAVMMNGAPLP